MIRIRCANKDKSIIELPKDAMFVELCDEDGKIAVVVAYDKLTKSINLFDANSFKAKNYSKFFNVKFVDKQYNATNLYK